MTLSPAGLAFLKRVEGFRSTLYPDADGFAIGYGCQVNPVAWIGHEITEADAEALLLDRLREFEAAVNQAVRMPLEQHQYDALVSLCYNIGATALKRSTLVRKINKGEMAGSANEFLRWAYSQGKPSEALAARRRLEKAMFEGEKLEV